MLCCVTSDRIEMVVSIAKVPLLWSRGAKDITNTPSLAFINSLLDYFVMLDNLS